MFKELIEKFAASYAHKTMQQSLYRSLNMDITDKEILKVPNSNKEYMLYAHIPFCHTFCPYCSFHKYAYDDKICKEYFIRLRKELTHLKEVGYDFSSMYVGGGTTLIDEDELLKTLELAKKLFSIELISCETDPNHLDPKELVKFKGLVDRLSVGVQSFDDEILKKVARYYKFGSGEVLKEKIKNAIGILPTLSLDLIFNFPFQTKEALLADIKIAKELNPQQITFYPLMKSEVTKEAIAKTLGISNKDNEKEFYNIIKEQFSDYHQNNAWAFSKEKEGLRDEYVGSNHEYVGAGSGAFSFLEGRLLVNAFNLNDYMQAIDNKKSPVIATCDFTESEKIKYKFLTELFDGKIDIAKFNQRHNVNLKKALFVELSLLKFSNAIKEESGFITPTSFGNYLCALLMKDFYAGMDRVRAVFRNDAKVKNSKILKIMQEEEKAPSLAR